MFKALFLFFTLLLSTTLGQDQPQPINKFTFGLKNLPHPDKVSFGGEDAFFVHENFLVVADGVGGWSQFNISSAAYSRRLCQVISDLVYSNEEKMVTDPKELLIETQQLDKEKASSTLMIVALDKKLPLLRTAQMGDSGYMIVRYQQGQWTVAKKSKEMQKSFNFPFQLASASANGDDPHLAKQEFWRIRDGDIVIVASDGLFDNLYDDQILMKVQEYFNAKSNQILDNPWELAKSIAEEAKKFSLDKDWASPFMTTARKQGFLALGVGGKSDDITVALGQARLTEEARNYNGDISGLSEDTEESSNSQQYEQAMGRRVVQIQNRKKGGLLKQ